MYSEVRFYTFNISAFVGNHK